jgi:hypothetical protein
MVALIVRQEIVLLIMGGVFVVETLSVIIQVASFKLTGKRVFRMAPLHHHYELKGWKENQVVVRFWIITMMLVLFGLSTLKLRDERNETRRARRTRGQAIERLHSTSHAMSRMNSIPFVSFVFFVFSTQRRRR